MLHRVPNKFTWNFLGNDDEDHFSMRVHDVISSNVDEVSEVKSSLRKQKLLENSLRFTCELLREVYP
jgi:hypothetical protein